MRPRLLPFEQAWTDAAFDAIFPDGTALPHGIKRLEPARYFDQLVFEVPLEQSIGLRLALWMIALAPLFAIGKLGTIASIDPVDRVRVLERMLASPIYAVRQLTLSLKAMATLLYVKSDAVRQGMTTPMQKIVPLRTRSAKTSRGEHEHAAE